MSRSPVCERGCDTIAGAERACVNGSGASAPSPRISPTVASGTRRTLALHLPHVRVVRVTHAVVRPIRVAMPDSRLETTVVRGVGFRAVCGDHYRGDVRKLRREAALDARRHNERVHR